MEARSFRVLTIYTFLFAEQPWDFMSMNLICIGELSREERAEREQKGQL